MSRVLELFGVATALKPAPRWNDIVSERACPFLDRTCLKNRKSEPSVLIGICTVAHGRARQPLIICPHRLLERRQVFHDCHHLLTLHQPGNELFVVPEVSIPGGSVDYFLISTHRRKVKDFVAIELQALDTTGTLWPERQRFLHSVGLPAKTRDVECPDPFGINWKMSAKTILMQLHHKVETLQRLGKHLVLVVQDQFFAYMRDQFDFSAVTDARVGDSLHIHAYGLTHGSRGWRLELASRASTDANGVNRFLGRQATRDVNLQQILTLLEERSALWTPLDVGPVTVVAPSTPPA
ncbi:MAG: NotI family restriction endonuclease [Tepidisphaeraceae bacterium]